MGRSRIRGTPSSTKTPRPAASTAARGRIAVPALPRKSSTRPASSGRPVPRIHSEPRPGSPRTSTVSARSAVSITRVSSLSSTPVTSVSPSASALSSRMRLDRLFEPGSTSVPSKRAMGSTVRRSGSMAHDKPDARAGIHWRSHDMFPRSAVEQSIPARFEEQVRRHPDRLAVKSGAAAWSYTELNARANRIAHAILEARSEPGETVALVLDQGVELVAAILGALKAGKIYVPLDPSLPAERLAELIADSRAPLVVTDARARPGTAAGRVLVATALAAGRPSGDPGLSIAPSAGAYVYYTSGSTGRPKGVLDCHRNVLHNVMRYTNTLRITSDDRLTLLQGPAFSGAVSSLFAALLNGGASFPYDVPKDGVRGIAPWLRREAITIYHSVPVLFRQVVSGDGSFPDLRLIRLEGDRASPGDVEVFRRRCAPGALLVNGLGATECGLVRQYVVSAETPVPASVLPVGYAVEDMEIVLLDEAGQERAAGEVGEIAVRSRYLATGYWRRPDLTADAFAAAPGRDGVRVYRTRDLGRMAPDGCLEHLGRKDFQAKIRGQRVDVGRRRSRAPRRGRREGRGGDHAPGRRSGAPPRGLRGAGDSPRAHRERAPTAPGRAPPRRHDPVRVRDPRPAAPRRQWQGGARRAGRARWPRGRRWTARSSSPGVSSSSSSRGSGSDCSASGRSARTTTSSISADTRCSPWRCSTRLERVLDRRVSPSVLLEGSTIERLADAIQREARGSAGPGRAPP